MAVSVPESCQVSPLTIVMEILAYAGHCPSVKDINCSSNRVLAELLGDHFAACFWGILRDFVFKDSDA